MASEQLDYAAVILVLTFLAYSAWSDWRTREVTNRVWMILAPSGVALTLLRILPTHNWTLYLGWGLIMGVMTLISFTLFYLGLWGGADSKAFLSLGLILPWPPRAPDPWLGIRLPVFPLTVLNNTILLSTSAVFYILARNIAWKAFHHQSLFQGFAHESRWKKLLALLVSYKVKKEKLQGKRFLSLAEESEAEESGGTPPPKRSFKFQIKEAPPIERWEELPEEVWVTPQPPLMVFIFLGTAAALWLGDLLLWLIAQFFP
ncbi:A24 family peptidase [Candidatus Hecatella orcuttiae]|jgi:preflagellin peptidase FlaK|uniref:A24 family peptidase n=1 Tax=Candidatus Hecatella orcuttiae TaxID=1935119 RepID=UPI002867FA3F|nr:A24 family peptidase [Candidatus Hecatella orcuttiae]